MADTVSVLIESIAGATNVSATEIQYEAIITTAVSSTLPSTYLEAVADMGVFVDNMAEQIAAQFEVEKKFVKVTIGEYSSTRPHGHWLPVR